MIASRSDEAPIRNRSGVQFDIGQLSSMASRWLRTSWIVLNPPLSLIPADSPAASARTCATRGVHPPLRPVDDFRKEAPHSRAILQASTISV